MTEQFRRFEYNSAEDQEWFPRLVANAISSQPVVDFRLKTGREGDQIPVLLLSLRFADDDQVVVSMRVDLARGVQAAMAELLQDYS